MNYLKKICSVLLFIFCVVIAKAQTLDSIYYEIDESAIKSGNRGAPESKNPRDYYLKDGVYQFDEGETETIENNGFKDRQMFLELRSILSIQTLIADKDLPKYFTAISMLSNDDNSISFKNTQYKISITGQKFIHGKHKIDMVLDEIRIDDDRNTKKKFWGLEGAVSILEDMTQIEKLDITYNNKKVTIPDSALDYLCEPNFKNISKENPYQNYRHKVLLSKDKKRMYVYMCNGNAAGAYDIIWIFKDNRYFGRVVMSNF